MYWDTDCVIYHHNSGNTHLLNDIPEALLKRCLLSVPYDKEDLHESIQQCAEFAGQDLSEYINQLLAILIKKDLIEQLT